MYKDPMPALQPQEYHTEPPLPPARKTSQKDYCVLTKIPEVPESSNRESTFLNQNPASNASFSFEKDKLQSLRIGPSYQTDVNDENVQKLKNEILQKCKDAIEDYDRFSALLRTIAIGVLSIDIIEIIASFFLLLILSLQYIPSDQIMLWIGLAMLLCLGEIFSAIKAINSSQNKSVKEMQEFICYAGLLCIAFMLACALLVLSLGGVILKLPEELTNDQKGKLVMVQGVLMVISFLKLIAQISFLGIGRFLKKQLLEMSGENGTAESSFQSTR